MAETNGDGIVQGPNTLGALLRGKRNVPYVLAVRHSSARTLARFQNVHHLQVPWLNNVAMTNTIVFWLGIYGRSVQPSPGKHASAIRAPTCSGRNGLPRAICRDYLDGQRPGAISSAPACRESSVLIPSCVVHCFNPTNAFEQLRDHCSPPKIYWLAAYAQDARQRPQPLWLENHDQCAKRRQRQCRLARCRAHE